MTDTQHNGKVPSSDEQPLPTYMKWIVGALCTVLLLSATAICFYAVVLGLNELGATASVAVGDNGNGPTHEHGDFAAIIAAIFGILITGVFIFMTFRIDHGAKLEARSTALAEAKSVLAEADRILNEAESKCSEALNEIVSKAEQAVTANVDQAKNEILSVSETTSKRLAEKAVERLRVALNSGIAQDKPLNKITLG